MLRLAHKFKRRITLFLSSLYLRYLKIYQKNSHPQARFSSIFPVRPFFFSLLVFGCICDSYVNVGWYVYFSHFKQVKMAHITAPSVQCQVRVVPTSSFTARPMTAKLWNSLLLNQRKKGTSRSSARFRVLALQSESSTVNRLKDLLNLDITPYTDKIIAEYIWYIPSSSIV